jgi:hypothetical protein
MGWATPCFCYERTVIPREAMGQNAICCPSACRHMGNVLSIFATRHVTDLDRFQDVVIAKPAVRVMSVEVADSYFHCLIRADLESKVHNSICLKRRHVLSTLVLAMSSAAIARSSLLFSLIHAPFILATPRCLPLVQHRAQSQAITRRKYTSKKTAPSDNNSFVVKDAEIDAAAIRAARAELEALRLAESSQHLPERAPQQETPEEVPDLDTASGSTPLDILIDVEQPQDTAYRPGQRASTVQEKWRQKWELTPEERRRERGRKKKNAKKAAAIAADHEAFLERQKAREARAALKEGSLRGMMTTKLDKAGNLRTLQSYDPNAADEDTEPDTPNSRRPEWAVRRDALKEKFPEGWAPRKKLSPDAMLGIKQLHASNPTMYTTPVLADQFKVSPEAIRRILKSKWLTQASPADVQRRREAWAKRHDAIWDQQSELGLRPKREKERRVRDASEGMDEFEEGVWRDRVLEEARRA